MMYLSPKTVQAVAKECYGTKMRKKVAVGISRRTAVVVNDLERVMLESDDELGEPAFTYSPDLGE